MYNPYDPLDTIAPETDISRVPLIRCNCGVTSFVTIVAVPCLAIWLLSSVAIDYRVGVAQRFDLCSARLDESRVPRFHIRFSTSLSSKCQFLMLEIYWNYSSTRYCHWLGISSTLDVSRGRGWLGCSPRKSIYGLLWKWSNSWYVTLSVRYFISVSFCNYRELE